MNSPDKSPEQILRTLTEALRDQHSDPDDLIHAFGDVEAKRIEVSEFLSSLLDRVPG